ncbi:MAG: M20/M25/M40 family metallo-hydrolase, partial [Flavobacteriales bacterium]|nr:M20/M25/M40 family metallo-hydrolase [Flavobacteriales bacterium]
VKGLSGGHSGMDIHLGLGNSNKLMNRLLFKTYENYGLRIAKIDGGGLRNAIPRESVATIAVPSTSNENFETHLGKLSAILKSEHGTTDSELEIVLEKTNPPNKVLNEEFQDQLLAAVYACPNGIYRMSPDVEGLVQTSNNVARVLVENGEFTVMCLSRSSVDSEKDDISNAIQGLFELIGATVTFAGTYPGWTPRPGSDIVNIMSDLYREMFNEEPHVNACHAGLECGILGTHYPEMEMISFGPNIRGAHSPDEKVQISSVQKYWGYLLETLKRIPQK